jgi:hypothetical protein
LQAGLREHFEAALAKKDFPPEDLAAGRRYVEAYVEYVHYVERVYEGSVKLSKGHYEEHAATLGKTRAREHRFENASAEHDGR